VDETVTSTVDQQLLLVEDLVLLLLGDRTGGLDPQGRYLLGAAVALDLARLGRVSCEIRPRRLHHRQFFLAPTGEGTLGHPLLQDAWDSMDAEPAESLRALERIGKRLLTSVPELLGRRGLIREVHRRRARIFAETAYVCLDRSHKNELEQSLRAALLERADPDLRTWLLIGLLSDDLLRMLFRRMEPHVGYSLPARRRAARIRNTRPEDEAVQQVTVDLLTACAYAERDTQPVYFF